MFSSMCFQSSVSDRSVPGFLLCNKERIHWYLVYFYPIRSKNSAHRLSGHWKGSEHSEGELYFYRTSLLSRLGLLSVSDWFNWKCLRHLRALWMSLTNFSFNRLCCSLGTQTLCKTCVGTYTVKHVGIRDIKRQRWKISHWHNTGRQVTSTQAADIHPFSASQTVLFLLIKLQTSEYKRNMTGSRCTSLRLRRERVIWAAATAAICERPPLSVLETWGWSTALNHPLVVKESIWQDCVCRARCSEALQMLIHKALS